MHHGGRGERFPLTYNAFYMSLCSVRAYLKRCVVPGDARSAVGGHLHCPVLGNTRTMQQTYTHLSTMIFLLRMIAKPNVKERYSPATVSGNVSIRKHAVPTCLPETEQTFAKHYCCSRLIRFNSVFRSRTQNSARVFEACDSNHPNQASIGLCPCVLTCVLYCGVNTILV